MSRSASTLACVLALSVVAGTCMGQDKLTVDAAVRQAITSHPRVQSAKYDHEAATAQIGAARALANPELTVSPSLVGPGSSADAVSFVQPLELNGARQARGRVAVGKSQITAAARRLTDREIALDVRTAYWQVALTEAIVALDVENAKYATDLLTASKRQVELGNEPASHALKAEVELARFRQQLERSKGEAEQAKAALNGAMGREPVNPVVLADGLVFKPLPVQDDVLLATALSQRAEIAQALGQLEVSRGEIDVARAARRPDVAIQARQEEFRGPAGLGLGVSLPLLDWGALKGDVTRAQAALRAEEQRLETTRNAIKLEVAAAAAQIRSTEAQIREYQERILAQTEQLAQMSLTGYREGATSYLEVLEARRTLRAVHLDYYSLLAEHLKAIARLDWAAGVEPLTNPVAEAAK